MIDFPRLYCIADAAFFRASTNPTAALNDFVRQLLAGGASLIQYRNKQGSAREMLSQARELRRMCSPAALGREVKLIMNDRADLCLAAGFDGVHVGQDDLSVTGARTVVGNRLWVGVSTHTIEQVTEADERPAAQRGSASLRATGANGGDKGADYIAIGPVFATGTKANPDPVIGVEGVRAARELTRKPLVAIGGITRANCRAVMEAGADAVAVISDLLRQPSKAVEEFVRLL